MALSEVEFLQSRRNRDRAAEEMEETGEVGVLTRRELAHCKHWPRAFSNERKDFHYFELVEDTLQSEFEYRYFMIKDATEAFVRFNPSSSSTRTFWLELAPPSDRRSRSFADSSRGSCACEH